MTSSDHRGDHTTWRDEVSDWGPNDRVEPSERWVRATLDGRVIGDSKRPILHVKYGQPIRPSSTMPELPGYFFPRADVDASVLESAEIIDGRRWWHANIDGSRTEYAAWTYVEPPGGPIDLKDHIALDWSAMDSWREEEEEVFAHARDPQHRVDSVPSSRKIEVFFEGQLLASSERPHLVFETQLPVRYYLPPEDVDFDRLAKSMLVTQCPYKGVASFWSVPNSTAGQDIAWSYPDPIEESPKLRDLIAFYNERLDISVDGEMAERPLTPWSAKD